MFLFRQHSIVVEIGALIRKKGEEPLAVRPRAESSPPTDHRQPIKQHNSKFKEVMSHASKKAQA